MDFETFLPQALAQCPKNPAGIAYSNTGIAYSQKHLEMRFRMLRKASMSTEQLANYVDAITMAFPDLVVDNTSLPEIPDATVRAVNMTCIGNVAYIALHATQQKHRDHYAKILAHILKN